MLLSGHTALFGGSFNPPHMGHQLACLYLLEALGTDRVWLLPAAVHPFGKPLLPFADRFAMCELLAQPFGGRVEVLQTEAELDRGGRTFDTLVHLRAEHPTHNFALVVGADIVKETSKWYRWPEIEQLARIVVLGRGGYDPQAAAEITLPAVSSSQIRERLQRGESIDGLVPTSVSAYIAQNSLFR